MHGRTRAQLYNGPADLPEKCDTPIPVIANGDIRTESDIVRVQNLGYDGAMIGRGMLGRPWLLGELSGVCTAPKNIGDIVLRHLDYMLEYYGEKMLCQCSANMQHGIRWGLQILLNLEYVLIRLTVLRICRRKFVNFGVAQRQYRFYDYFKLGDIKL